MPAGPALAHFPPHDIRVEHPPIALERQRLLRVGRIDLAGQPVPVEDGIGDQPGRDAIADAVQGRDAFGLESRQANLVLELAVERLVGTALGDEHHRVHLPDLVVAVLIVHVRCDDLAFLQAFRYMVRDQLDPKFVQLSMHIRRLKSEVHVGGDVCQMGH